MTLENSILRNERVSSVVTTLGKIGLFTLLMAACYRVDVIVLFLVEQGVITAEFDPFIIRAWIEPLLALGYTLGFGHLLFDFRAALHPSGPAVKRAGAAFVATFLLSISRTAFGSVPTSLHAIGRDVYYSAELWAALLVVFVPIAVSAFATTTNRATLRDTAVLTGVCSMLVAILEYVEAVYSPLEYTSWLAFLLDPAFEMAIELQAGMLAGLLIGGVVVAFQLSWGRVRPVVMGVRSA